MDWAGLWNGVWAGLRDTRTGTMLEIDWGQFGALITAVGALGVAAFGVVEALGKVFAISFRPGRDPLSLLQQRQDRRAGRRPRPRRIVRWGLPYAGFGVVYRMIEPLRPALRSAYGADYLEIIAQQYRADRASGRAPDTVREGVKLGVPFLEPGVAAELIGKVWALGPERSAALAAALQAEPQEESAVSAAQLLAGRFATALDERVNAAFALAEEQYQAQAKMWAAVAAVALAMLFNMSLASRFPWWVAAMIGVVAVPLAPVAKDLSSALQNALTAFKSIPSRR